MKKVLVITNMPCSSGTFYTSFIGKSLSSNSWVVDETSPNEPNSYGLKAFSLSVPLLKECLRGKIPLETWQDCYRGQVREIFQHWKRSESDLLIFRGHAWTEANSQTQLTLADVLGSLGIEFETIYTHRNPVDTWLGFNSSFPESAKGYNLDSFAQVYTKSISQWSRANKQTKMIHMRTEDIAMDSRGSMQRLRKLLNIRYRPEIPTSIHKEELGTGASGRAFETPVVPKRRPYSMQMIKEAKRSIPFQTLQSNLGYRPGLGTINTSTLIMSAIHSLYQPILGIELQRNLTVSIAASKLGLRIAYY